MNKYAYALLMLLFYNSSLHASGGDNVRGHHSNYPISVVVSLGNLIDHRGNIISKTVLIESAKKWNNVRDSRISLATGCTYSDKTLTNCVSVGEGNLGYGMPNGANEINLHRYPFQNAQDLAVTRIGSIGSTIVEADMFFNDSDFVFYAGNRPSPCVGRVANAIEAMIHESGHMIGLGHASPTVTNLIMRRSNGGCNQSDNIIITPGDVRLYNNHFDDSVTITMINPRGGDVMFAGYNDLIANITQLNGINIKGGALNADWESSIDGFLSSGNDTIGFLTPGNHTITASVQDPQTGRSVGDSALVSVVDDTFEIANLEPVPCVRLKGTNSCFMQYDAILTSFPDSCILIEFDEFTSGVEGDLDRFGVTHARVDDTCRSGINPIYEHRIRANTWITSTGSTIDNYRFRFRVRRSGQTTRYETIGGLLPIVDTNISISQDTLVCDLTEQSSCDISLLWQNHFFDVGTGLFKRTSSGSWSFVQQINDEQGSLTYTATAQDAPLEFAVFQYSFDVGSLPGFPIPTSPEINAPAGLLAGPFEIELLADPDGALTSDSPCTVQLGNTNCTVTIIGMHENIPVSCLWRTTPGTLKQYVGCTSDGLNTRNYDWPWNRIDLVSTFDLRGHNSVPSNDIDGFNSGMLLDSISTTAVDNNNVPSGTLSSDSPCAVNVGETHCTTTINSLHEDTPISCLWRTTVGAPITRIGCTFNNLNTREYLWTWNSIGKISTFDLRAHNSIPVNDLAGYNSGILLDTIETTAVSTISNPTGSLSSDSPCSIDTGESHCTTVISSVHNDTPVSCLWRTTPGAPIIKFGCTFNGLNERDYLWTWNSIGKISTFDLRAHDDIPENDIDGYNSGMLLDVISTTAIDGSSGAAGNLSSDSPCTVETGQTKCSVTISTNHDGIEWGCLWLVSRPPPGEVPVKVYCDHDSPGSYIWIHAKSDRIHGFEWLGYTGVAAPGGSLDDYNSGLFLDDIEVTAVNE